MDDPNLTMEEYIRLEEEKAHKHGKVFNWQTATYGKIRVDDDLHNLSSVEAEFPAIVINDAVAPQDELQCKSQVSTPVNDEIDFRISFDESDDEDYTILFDKNSFSYKMISVNDSKMDSKNDYEKVMPSIPSPEPAISCFDDLDFFTDFENEFPAIVYNDAQTSKLDLLTKPILNPQHIDEFDLIDKTSLSEYDEEEQNVLYFNDLFPFNIIHPDNLKSKKDNDDSKIDIILSFEDNFDTPYPLSETECLNFYTLVLSLIDFADMALPPREQRHGFLRYESLEVPVFDFGGLPDLMAEGLSGRMLMEHRDEAGAILDLDTPGTLQFQLGGARRRMSWRQFILALGLHTEEEMQKAGFNFLSTTPSYTLIGDPILRMDIGSVNVPYLLARYLRLFAARRKSGAHISGGLFVCVELDDTWAWVAMGPKRQPVSTAGAPAIAEDAPIIDEGGQADSAPEQAPQQPPLPPPAHARTMP
ncbi:hypothetical protein Tco_1028471 [Tanacetum coccineum]|uniref:Uncharacterized protein n=1 Tax=Tanacetum coccineum TaxID=301880 RepID=A0ABQ5G0N2_9ASTR